MVRLHAIQFFILLACLGLSSCSTSTAPAPSSQKPEGIVAPVAVLGIVSDVRKRILQNTLNDSVSQTFKVVPQERFEEARERAFQELDYNQCTEDQCIMLIQEYLQVEHVFQLEVVSEGPVVQLSLKLVTLDEKKTKTDICEKCNSDELSQRVRILTEKILTDTGLSDSGVAFKKSEPRKAVKQFAPKRIQPKPPIEKTTPKKMESIKGEAIKTPKALAEMLNKEKIKPVAAKPESPEKTEVEEPSDIRIRTLGGASSSNNISVSSNSFSFTWNGYGAGASNISYQNKSSAGRSELSASTLEFSYSFGDEWSYALGMGLLANGSGTITTPNGNYKTTDASGTTYQALFGMEWSGIEGLIGYQSMNLEYKGFKNNSDGSTLSTPISISGGLLLFGFGVHF